jgi:hypothetical protein
MHLLIDLLLAGYKYGGFVMSRARLRRVGATAITAHRRDHGHNP